ncbi:carbohydrate ABC transporter permease [Lederbergia citrea]
MKPNVRKTLRRNLEGYIFISPWILGMLLFTVGPIIASIYISMTDWDTFTNPEFLGFKNYVDLSHDPKFWQALKVTFTFAIFSVPLNLTGGLFTAILLNQKVKGMKIFRTIFYLPSVVSGVATALLWRWIFNTDVGLINTVLAKIGLSGPNWLGDPSWVMPSYVIISLWGFGNAMLVFLAALQDMPKDLYESADLDGANHIHKFWYITVPMLSPIILFNLIMGIIGGLKIFTEAYVIGGAGDAALFYMLYLWRNAFEFLKMGYASAMAWVLFTIILLITLVVLKSSPLWVYYEGKKK